MHFAPQLCTAGHDFNLNAHTYCRWEHAAISLGGIFETLGRKPQPCSPLALGSRTGSCRAQGAEQTGSRASPLTPSTRGPADSVCWGSAPAAEVKDQNCKEELIILASPQVVCAGLTWKCTAHPDLPYGRLSLRNTRMEKDCVCCNQIRGRFPVWQHYSNTTRLKLLRFSLLLFCPL